MRVCVCVFVFKGLDYICTCVSDYVFFQWSASTCFSVAVMVLMSVCAYVRV